MAQAKSLSKLVSYTLVVGVCLGAFAMLALYEYKDRLKKPEHWGMYAMLIGIAALHAFLARYSYKSVRDHGSDAMEDD